MRKSRFHLYDTDILKRESEFLAVNRMSIATRQNDRRAQKYIRRAVRSMRREISIRECSIVIQKEGAVQ